MSFRGIYQSGDNIFGVSNGNDLMPNFNPAQPGYSFQGDAHFNLGVLPSTQDPAKYFNVSSGADLMGDLNQPKVQTLMDFLEAGAPKPEKYIGDLVVDMTPLGFVKTTADIGKGFQEVVRAVEQNEENKLEAALCKTAKVATELTVSEGSTRVILGGMGLLVLESIEYPPLALAIPDAAQAIPQAYANAQEFAKFLGKKAEEDCHLLFSKQ